MPNLAYLTPERAIALLANPPSLEVMIDRLNQLEGFLTGWFNFRFPETDYLENITTRNHLLTLRQYPVVSVSQVRYAQPVMPGSERSYSTVNTMWISDRTVRVPCQGVYQCSYRAGYGLNELAKLEPLLIDILARWEETGGLNWLWQPSGEVIEVSLPGGISQRKQFAGSSALQKRQTEGDRFFASFAGYRRKVIT